MQISVKTGHGQVEVHTARRTDKRWSSDYRYVPHHGTPTEWTSAYSPEGFLSEGMALNAGILMAKELAQQRDAQRHTTKAGKERSVQRAPPP